MAKDADYSFELIINETCAPQFNGLNKSFLGSVNQLVQFEFSSTNYNKEFLT
jgi:hypothetical protein